MRKKEWELYGGEQVVFIPVRHSYLANWIMEKKMMEMHFSLI